SLAQLFSLRYNTAQQAVTEESRPGKPDRDAGTQTEIPARHEPAEVPSRAAQVKPVLHGAPVKRGNPAVIRAVGL
ncbi:MAG TPA: hypothetical protein PL171_01485, partial [Anaerolineaceae bacterium]|nr:hypothetical protein [Anaerolineaceae bacterium]